MRLDAPYELFGDHLGSTSRVANADGSPLTDGGELRYKPWGEKRFPADLSAIPTTFRFTGQRQEVLLGGADGLYYYGARWFDPYLGRFIEADTIVPDPKNPKSLDRFAYVNNNPLKYIDPDGHTSPCAYSNRDPECDDIGDNNGGNNSNGNGSNSNGNNGGGISGTQPYPVNISGANNNWYTLYSEYINRLMSYDKQYGICIHIWNIGCSGGEDYRDWWVNEYHPLKSYSPLWGFNISGSTPMNHGYYSAGHETIFLPNDTSSYNYGGEGNSIGGGASATLYIGVVVNLKRPEDYVVSPFATFGSTISYEDVGFTAAYFWDSNNGPFSKGAIQGFFVGYSPGAQASVWNSVTNYLLISTNR